MTIQPGECVYPNGFCVHPCISQHVCFLFLLFFQITENVLEFFQYSNQSGHQAARFTKL